VFAGVDDDGVPVDNERHYRRGAAGASVTVVEGAGEVAVVGVVVAAVDGVRLEEGEAIEAGVADAPCSSRTRQPSVQYARQ
jgi:hypothetical protein